MRALVLVFILSGSATWADKTAYEWLCDEQTFAKMQADVADLLAAQTYSDMLHAGQSALDQKRFADYQVTHQAYADAAKAFRTAFLKACYDN